MEEDSFCCPKYLQDKDRPRSPRTLDSLLQHERKETSKTAATTTDRDAETYARRTPSGKPAPITVRFPLEWKRPESTWNLYYVFELLSSRWDLSDSEERHTAKSTVSDDIKAALLHSGIPGVEKLSVNTLLGQWIPFARAMSTDYFLVPRPGRASVVVDWKTTSCKRPSEDFVDRAESAKRAARFADSWEALAAADAARGQEEADEEDKCQTQNEPVRGTCQTLEKQFFRLTSARVDPSTVRPEEVLIRALEMVKRRHRSDGDYGWACDQMRSIRQDLVVQHIQSEFAIEVYEVHARMALASDDLGEFNQCQTQLDELYVLHPHSRNIPEFTALKLLYFMVTEQEGALFRVHLQLARSRERNHSLHRTHVVEHADALRRAMQTGDIMEFFALAKNSQLTIGTSCAPLIQRLVDAARMRAFQVLLKAYRPTSVPLDWACQFLGMSDLQEGARWITSNAGVITSDGKSLDTKSRSPPPE